MEQTQNNQEKTYTYICGSCEKTFPKERALRMHKIRVHTPAGKRGYKWKQSAHVRGKWTPERHARFSRTMAAKKRQKRIQYVYPEPTTKSDNNQTSPLELLAEKVTQPIRRLRHCPYCGENIQRHLALES